MRGWTAPNPYPAGPVARWREIPVWLWATTGLALVVRVAFVIVQIELEPFDIAFDADDTVVYRSIADNLREHGRYWYEDRPTAFVTPGYPLFLAVVYLAGRSVLLVAVVQAFVGAITVGLVAATANQLAGRRAAWFAGLIAAVYPHLVFWTGYVLTETLFVFTLALAVCLLVRAVQARGDVRWASLVAGAAFGAAVLTRPMVLAFALPLGLVALAFTRWRRHAVAGLVGFILIWGPWVVRNAMTMDALVVTSTESATVLYQGNNPGATGGTRGYVDTADYERLDLPRGLGEVERERRFRSAALTWMRENPREVIALAPKRLANMFRPTYAEASRLNTIVTLATYPALLVAGGAGLVLLSRRELAGRLILVLVLTFLALHAVVTGMIRFRLPVELLLCISAGVALDWVARRRSVST